MGKFTVIPEDTFKRLQMDAGVFLKRFDPANPVAPADEDIVCPTTGGFNITAVPTYSDLGEDVDNCPVNMMELKHLDSWDIKVSFTALDASEETIKLSLGAADVDPATGKISPRRDLKMTDFTDRWWIGDRADGGLVAVHIFNALSTGGFSYQSQKNSKGQLTIEIGGHVSLKAQNVMPIEFYSLDPEPFQKVSVSAESGTVSMFGTPVSDMQTGVAVEGNKIVGTLKFLDTGALVDRWGEGNFLALKFADIDENATSCMVGLEPSVSSGLVDILSDPDKNGAFKITDKDSQKFVVVTSDGETEMKQSFDLSSLTCEIE